jgi:hypothetical protein
MSIMVLFSLFSIQVEAAPTKVMEDQNVYWEGERCG